MVMEQVAGSISLHFIPHSSPRLAPVSAAMAMAIATTTSPSAPSFRRAEAAAIIFPISRRGRRCAASGAPAAAALAALC